MSDDLDVYLADLIRWESLPADGGGAFAYLDSKGLVTMGVGEHLSVADFARVGGWSIGDRFATPEELGAAYAALVELGKQYQDEHPGATVPYAAEHYAKFTVTRLPVAVCMQRCKDRLAGEFLPALESACGGYTPKGIGGQQVYSVWEHLPDAAQRVLVDLCWNSGAQGFAAEWPKLLRAVRASDWTEASRQCITVNAGEAHEDAAKRPRNVWRRDLMLSCAGPTS